MAEHWRYRTISVDTDGGLEPTVKWDSELPGAPKTIGTPHAPKLAVYLNEPHLHSGSSHITTDWEVCGMVATVHSTTILLKKPLSF